jgi:hypothetical protein
MLSDESPQRSRLAREPPPSSHEVLTSIESFCKDKIFFILMTSFNGRIEV